MNWGKCRRKVWWVVSVIWLFASVSCATTGKTPTPEERPAAQPTAPAKKEPTPQPVTKPGAKEELKKEDYFVHEVKWVGESLSIIAGWYTGDIQNWKALAPFNPHIKPDVIRMGDRIQIPRDMMKTQDPMPREYVESYVPHPGGQTRSPSSKEKPSQDEPKLFGPKPLPKR